MKSNTVIFTEPYKAEIQEIDCPKPGKSEVLIRTEQTLISTGTELTFLTGECPEKSKWSEYIHYPQKSRTADDLSVHTERNDPPDYFFDCCK